MTLSNSPVQVAVGGELLWRLPGDDVPRVSDKQLAERFGIARKEVRRVIREQTAELVAVAPVLESGDKTARRLESLRNLPPIPAAPTYFLTLEQALLLAMHLRSPRASEARIALAKLGAAAARGELGHPGGELSFVARRVLQPVPRTYERLFDDELLAELRRLGDWDAVPASCYRRIYDLLVGTEAMGELRSLGISGRHDGNRHHQHFKPETVQVVGSELDKIKTLCRNCNRIESVYWHLEIYYGRQPLLPGVDVRRQGVSS